MKRIFLVTWFISENYGTCLQAYATHRVLAQAGYDVTFLNRRTYYPLTKINYLIPKLRAVIKSKFIKPNVDYGKYQNEHSQKIKKTQRLVDETYKLKNIANRRDIQEIDNEFDCYLVGSDQMWNPWVISPQYLLDFVPTKSIKPRYSYAASFGVEHIPAKKIKLYRKYLPQFKCISVRESNAVNIVRNIAGLTATLVLDPTFLLSQDDWRGFAEQSNSIRKYGLKDYVLCYFLGEVYDHLSTVKKIARQLNMKVAIIAMKAADYQVYDPDITVIADACSYDFISLIDNARLVCTDSFHAIVFSFQMNTSFYCFPRFAVGDSGSQDSRLYNIIDKFKLKGSMWNDKFSLDDIRKHLVPDYKDGIAILRAEREISLNFLLNMIEGNASGNEKTIN